MVISGWPTATTAPGAAWISATAPANGTGTSTAALAVSTSTIDLIDVHVVADLHVPG